MATFLDGITVGLMAALVVIIGLFFWATRDSD